MTGLSPCEYYTKYGCITIRQIICRWAPETENQVEAYIKTVVRGQVSDIHYCNRCEASKE